LLFGVAVSALTFAHSGEAKLSIPKTLEQYFDAADLVAVATITDYRSLHVDGARCAVQYSALIVEQFKPGENAASISFGRYDGLAVGHTYLLFLKYVSDPSAARRELAENGLLFGPKENVPELVSCHGIVPGFAFDPDAAWEIKDGSVTIVGLLPQSLPKTIAIVEGATAEWFLRGPDVFSYLQRLQADRVREK
jgi:hypothetical protein